MLDNSYISKNIRYYKLHFETNQNFLYWAVKRTIQSLKYSRLESSIIKEKYILNHDCWWLLSNQHPRNLESSEKQLFDTYQSMYSLIIHSTNLINHNWYLPHNFVTKPVFFNINLFNLFCLTRHHVGNENKTGSLS